MTPEELATKARWVFGAKWQSKLAKASGYSQAHISNVLAGRKKVPEELMKLLTDMENKSPPGP